MNFANGSFAIATTLVLAFPFPLAAASRAEKLARKPDAWFASADGQQTLDNILAWQTENGDWPKNVDTTRPPTENRKTYKGTFDNGATTGELRALARATRVTEREDYQRAFVKGFDHIVRAQYANGGWPQYFPLSRGYHRHITFNDGSMVRILQFLSDVTEQDDFRFLDRGRRQAAEEAVSRGIDCILRCQVSVDGNLTVWCAQHHAETLEPVQARSYEHPSLSGSESAGVLLFLMNLDSPSREVIQSISAGATWFEESKIQGYRQHKRDSLPTLTKDANAPPLWARFYEIESNRPIFSDRDGVIKYDIDQIGRERRMGYAWYGHWGQRVADAYARWPHRESQGN